ncbi:MAG: hypothetical protein M3003_04970 [Candidatus Dormibacteraeota bacterium]|nr:hypothetical protein [Candidatus Dormibacteraeota bacterium]
MNLRYLVGLLFLIGAVLVATVGLPWLWRGDRTGSDSPQWWWPYGDRAWRHYFRTLPLSIIAALLLGLTVTALPFLPNRPPQSLLWVVPMLVGFLILFVLATTVWLWNWPKVVVPPYLRNEPGALSRNRTRGPVNGVRPD